MFRDGTGDKYRNLQQNCMQLRDRLDSGWVYSSIWVNLVRNLSYLLNSRVSCAYQSLANTAFHQ